MVMIVLSQGCNSFSFDEIWNSAQIEGPEFNGDNFFRDSWSLSILAPVIFWATVLDQKQQIFQFGWNFAFYTNRGW